MVTVLIEGQPFTLSEDDIVNSRTIQDLIQYQNHCRETPICLPFSLTEWSDYVKFLDSERQAQLGTYQPLDYVNVNALYIIDYLDNFDQYKNWYIIHLNNYYSFAQVVRAVNSTSFRLSDINPFFRTKHIEEMLDQLQFIFSIGTGIGMDYIGHIITTLFNEQVYDLYYQTINIKQLQHLYCNDILIKLKQHNFIVLDKDNNYINDISVDNYQASHYTNLIGDNNNNRIVNSSQLTTVPSHVGYYCVDDRFNVFRIRDNSNQDQLTTTYPKVHRYLNEVNNGHYCLPTSQQNLTPITVYDSMETNHHTFQDCWYVLTIDEYKVYTYNTIILPQSHHDHDYHLFLVYEIDTHNKILFAFCLV